MNTNNADDFTLDALLKLINEHPHRRPGTRSLADLRDRIDQLAAEAKASAQNPRRKRQRDYYMGAKDAYGHLARLVRELIARTEAAS